MDNYNYSKSEKVQALDDAIQLYLKEKYTQFHLTVRMKD